jgi:hypothetical protein
LGSTEDNEAKEDPNETFVSLCFPCVRSDFLSTLNSQPSTSPILFVADLFQPIDQLAVERFLNGDMRINSNVSSKSFQRTFGGRLRTNSLYLHVFCLYSQPLTINRFKRDQWKRH